MLTTRLRFIMETTKILRAIKREQAIREGQLVAYRMPGRTIPAKKGKGSYTRSQKHRGRIEF
jgi:hypothetical protein